MARCVGSMNWSISWHEEVSCFPGHNIRPIWHLYPISPGSVSHATSHVMSQHYVIVEKKYAKERKHATAIYSVSGAGELHGVWLCVDGGVDGGMEGRVGRSNMLSILITVNIDMNMHLAESFSDYTTIRSCGSV